MTDILLIGLSHKTASLEVRECLAFDTDDTVNSLKRLGSEPPVNELLIFSTCNRVEMLIATEDTQAAIHTAKKYLSEFKNIPREKYEHSLYIHEGEDAVRHIFRVASSLDSMVVGEPQILGQIKEAYQAATRNKTSGVILNRLLHRTFFVAKKIRHETGIGDSAVSVSYAAIELARKIFGALENKKILLIGAGEMAEMAVHHLIRHRAGEIFVANRTFKQGLALAERFKGQAIKLEEIADFLQHADIVISSTGSSDYVITRDTVKQNMRARRNRPLFFIDIAVPRDIDPDVNRIDNAYVYDIDDLKGIIDENIHDRQKEAVKGERIVDEAVIKFLNWHKSLDAVPTIIDLRNKMSEIAGAEVNKTYQNLKHLSESDREAITRMTDSIVNKILHDPTLHLKNYGRHGHRTVNIDITRRLFNLDNHNDIYHDDTREDTTDDNDGD